jgi:hypothetical protein
MYSHGKSRFLPAVLVILAPVLHQVPANAADNYFAVEAGYKAFNHVDTRSTLSQPNVFAKPADGDIDGYGIALTVGTPMTTLPVLAGSNTAMEIKLHYADADESHSESASATGRMGFMPIDGSGISVGGLATRYDYDTKFEYYGIDALVLSELSRKPGTTISTFWGLTYSRFSQAHEFTGYNGNTLISDRMVEDNVDTDYFGVALGLGVEHSLGSKWMLSATGRLDLMAGYSELDADQVLLIYGTLDQGDDDLDFAARLQGKMSLSRDFGGFSAGVNATVEYLSYAPEVVYAQYDLDPFPAYLDEEDLINYGFNLFVKVPF